MVLSHLLANDSVVGIDIGSNQIKIIRAEPSRNGANITHVAICPTPQDTIKEGVVTDIVEVAATVRNCMRTAGIKAPNAIAAIAGPGVIVRQVQMPVMPEKLLRKSILFEAGKYISSSSEDSVVEFEILESSREDGQMIVMLASAPRTMVETRVAVLEQAGLEPMAIDVEAFSMLRSLIEYNSNISLMGNTIAILDIGASHSEINLSSKGNLDLSRTIPIGGDSLTNAIKGARSSTVEEAEAYKHEMDLTELCDMPAGSTSDPSLRAAQSLMDELLREIRRSVNYYQSQLPDGSAENSIDTLILTGGTARFKGLGPYIHSRLGMNITIGNPDLMKYINSSEAASVNAEDLPLISVAFGLAVKEMHVVSNKALSAA